MTRRKPVSRRPSPSSSRSSTGPKAPTRVKAGGPADLLALVPYLLGFRPSESLVLLLIRGGQVLLTARVDLPPPELRPAVLEQLSGLADQHDAEAVVLFGFGEDAAATRELLEALVSGLGSRQLLDAVYADGARWWSLTCAGGCCPAEGTPYDPSTSALAAEAVYAGLSTVPDRSALEAQVSGPAADEVAQLTWVAQQAARELRSWSSGRRSQEMAELVRNFLARPRRLSDAECARLAVLAGDIGVRDVAWALMDRIDIDDHLDLWGQVVARTVPPWEPAPLCLLGMAAWISGNGALQNCCSERARLISPDYTLVALLDEINQRALSPSFWDELAAELRTEIVGAGGPLAG